MRLRALLVAAMAVFFATGCAAAITPVTLTGGLYTEVHGPVDAGPRVGPKEGRACSQSILGIIATGDASIKNAAQDGGITNIGAVDHYTRIILGVFAEYCTIVYGS